MLDHLRFWLATYDLEMYIICVVCTVFKIATMDIRELSITETNTNFSIPRYRPMVFTHMPIHAPPQVIGNHAI